MLKPLIFIALGMTSFGVFIFYFLYEVYREIDED
jgi:hypothetical protein